MTPNPRFGDEAAREAPGVRPPPSVPPQDGSRTAGGTDQGARGDVRWEQDEALVRALFSQSRIGVALHDPDMRVTRASLGDEGPPAGRGQVAGGGGYRLSELLVAEDAAVMERTMRMVYDTGESLVEVPFRARLRARPDVERMLSMSVLPLMEADGSRMGVATAYTDITEQHRAEKGRCLVNEAAKRLAASLDVTRCAEEVSSLLVPRFADLAAVDVTEIVLIGEEPGDLERHAPMRRVAVAAAVGGWPPEVHQPGDQVRIRTRETEALRRASATLVPDMTEMRESFTPDPDRSRLLLPAEAESFLAVPLHARGLVLGAVILWRTRGQVPFDRQDAELAEEIVSRAGLSMDNARRYTRERRTAEALRRGLLAPARVRVTAADVAGMCVPAASTAGVGGTWFDVVPLPSARVAFVVGDTAGNGLEASAATGRLRTAVRTLSDLDLPPEELLTHLDELAPRLSAGTGSEPSAPVPGAAPDDTAAAGTAAGLTGSTCLYAVYDPVTGSCVMSSAGHPPPVVISPNGEAQVLTDVTGPRLGEGGQPFEPVSVPLPRGSFLAFCSGNLVAGAGAGAGAGSGRGAGDGTSADRTDELSGHLSAGARRHACPAVISRETLAAMVPEAPGKDVSLLVARTRRISPEATVSWEFPSEPASVARARDDVTAQLARWGLDELAYTTELTVSELVTNAIRYAGDPVRLRLIKDSTLICEVSDPSQTQPRLRRARLSDEGGRGLFLVHQLTDRWGSRYTSAGKTIWTEQSLPGGAPDG